MNKKIILSVYYTGLAIGIIIINFMLLQYQEYGNSIMEGFWEMDKLEYVNGQELFLYIFLKRAKQVTVLCFLYLQISKAVTLYLTEFYFAAVEGMVLSLCTYYYGILGAISGAVMLIPQFFSFSILHMIGWKIYENKKNNLKISFAKWIIFLIIQIIIVTLMELLVNFWFGVRFFVNK